MEHRITIIIDKKKKEELKKLVKARGIRLAPFIRMLLLSEKEKVEIKADAKIFAKEIFDYIKKKNSRMRPVIS